MPIELCEFWLGEIHRHRLKLNGLPLKREIHRHRLKLNGSPLKGEIHRHRLKLNGSPLNLVINKFSQISDLKH